MSSFVFIVTKLKLVVAVSKSSSISFNILYVNKWDGCRYIAREVRGERYENGMQNDKVQHKANDLQKADRNLSFLCNRNISVISRF